MKQLQYIISNSTDPYLNQALGQYLFEALGSDTEVLFLWQNDPCLMYGQDYELRKDPRYGEILEEVLKPVRLMTQGDASMSGPEDLHVALLSQNDAYLCCTLKKLLRDAKAKTADGDSPCYQTQKGTRQMLQAVVPGVILADAEPEACINRIIDFWEGIHGQKAESYPFEQVEFPVLRSYAKMFEGNDWLMGRIRYS